MGLFSTTTLNSMGDLLLEQLKDIYDAEHRITDALPLMSEAASSPMLKNAFDTHLQETRGHIRRLDQIFAKLGVDAERQTCPAIKGLLKEGDEMINAEGNPHVKDAALIASAQRVEHYEMAAYGSARTFASRVGRADIADILQMTLNEERAADTKLTQVAEQDANAMSPTASNVV